MVKTRKYRRWIEQNLDTIREGLDKPERFPVEIEITVVEGRGFHHRHDIDNINKAIVDLLVRAEILPDDNVRYVSKCVEKFMPFYTTKSEALTMIRYFEPED